MVRSVVIALLFVSSFSFAQTHSYFISFTDKAGQESLYSSPESFLGPKSIARRINQNIEIDYMDLPVVDAYVDSVRDAGAQIIYRSKWFNGVLVRADTNVLNTITELSFVSAYEKGARNGIVEEAQTSGFPDLESHGPPIGQHQMIGIDQMHYWGYTGHGVGIAVIDAGFKNCNSIDGFDHVFEDGRVVVSYDLVARDSMVYDDNSHGTWVWSALAARDSGVYIGAAPDASYYLYRSEDASKEIREEEYYMLKALEMADSAGVDIVNISLGYTTFDDSQMDYTTNDLDGETSVGTRACEMAYSRGILVLTSIGNYGASSWQKMTTPGDGKHILTVGGTYTDYSKSNGSSFGPTADGRLKPEVACLGFNVSVLNTLGEVSTRTGTSFSSPQIAGLAAGVWQKYPTLTAAELRSYIIESGHQFDNPDTLVGYGVPSFGKIVELIEAKNNVVITENDIFPNPISEGEFNVVLPCTGDFALEIYDNLGHLMRSSSMTCDNLPCNTGIEVSSLTPGVYTLQIKGEAYSNTFRFVSQK